MARKRSGGRSAQALRALVAWRTARSQQQHSGKMDGLAWLAALVVGGKTYREQKRSDQESRVTLREALGGE